MELPQATNSWLVSVHLFFVIPSALSRVMRGVNIFAWGRVNLLIYRLMTREVHGGKGKHRTPPNPIY